MKGTQLLSDQYGKEVHGKQVENNCINYFVDSS